MELEEEKREGARREEALEEFEERDGSRFSASDRQAGEEKKNPGEM